MPKRTRSHSTLTKLCPCGSNKTLQNCCFPILQNHSLASTPEKLMRSRYTAFVLKNAAHLLASWDIHFRPATMTFDEKITWLRLTILQAPPPGDNASHGHVEFSVSFLHGDYLVNMRERSSFIKKNDCWYYQQGETTTQKQPLSLNAPCPCGSAKKFKRCCRQ